MGLEGVGPALIGYGPIGIAFLVLLAAIGWLGKTLYDTMVARVEDAKTMSAVIVESTTARRDMTVAFTELSALVRSGVELQRIRDEVERREARQA